MTSIAERFLPGLMLAGAVLLLSGAEVTCGTAEARLSLAELQAQIDDLRAGQVWVLDGDGNALGLLAEDNLLTFTVFRKEVGALMLIKRTTGELDLHSITYELPNCKGQGYTDFFLSGVVFRAPPGSPTAMFIGSENEFLAADAHESVRREDGTCDNQTGSNHFVVPVHEFNGDLGLTFPLQLPVSVDSLDGP
jgi:hypothetical protein